MTMRKMYLAFPLVCAATAQGLTGCGDASSKVRDQLVPTTISGFAIDGKLENADCCLDTNRNRTCDTSELTSVTSSLGQYEFVTLNPSVGLVCKAIPGSTRDTATNTIVTREYTLVAPPLAKTVNPLTTLAQVAFEQGLATSFEAAADLVLEKVGLKDVSIGGAKIDVTNFDYDALSSGTDTAAAEVAKKVLVVATLVTESIATNIDTIKVAAAGSTEVDAVATTRNAADLAVLNLLQAASGSESPLEQITKAVDNVLATEGSNFSIDKLGEVVQKSVDEAATTVTLISVNDVLEAIKKVDEITRVNNPPIEDTPLDATGATGGTGATGATGVAGISG